ncbi:hypothetical protein TCON_0345 [Astathelohania contejeani]|uniref:Uncharacterized protein n=1 Tax=Astathelohania contejeani TaxID=164912 RepID=A0ABQ7I240_9MICR|nr:hypothetical protein TCON_0345 [Thelohania contejeani]
MDEINPLEFIKARAAEIEDLEASLSTNTKKTMLFQRLPFHKRRRNSSYRRRRSTKSAKPHRWFAKRFRMVDLYGVRMPMESNHKSDSYIYKSQERGFIFHEAYKKAYVYQLIENCKEINYTIRDSVQICILEGERVEVAIIDKCLIIIQMCEKHLVEAPFLFSFEKIFLLLKGKNRRTGRYLNEELVEQEINAKYDEKSYLFIKYSFDSIITGIVLTCYNVTGSICDYFTRKGMVVIGIKEALRVALENKELLYPFDYPNLHLFKQYEAVLMDPIKAKYDRTPPAKRPVYNADEYPFYLPLDNIVSIWYFKCLRGGCLKKGAMIYSKENEIIGYVLRGAFSYTIGKCAGICYLIKDFRGTTWGKNIGSPIKYEMSLEHRYNIESHQ